MLQYATTEHAMTPYTMTQHAMYPARPRKGIARA